MKGLAIRFSKIKNQENKFKIKYFNDISNYYLQQYEKGSLNDLKNYLKIKEIMKRMSDTNLGGHAVRGRFDHCVEHEELGMPRVIREIQAAKKKEIFKIKDENGKIITDRNEIRQLINNQYINIFTLEKKDPRDFVYFLCDAHSSIPY